MNATYAPRIIVCEPAAGDIDPTTGLCTCGCGRRSPDFDMRVRRGDADPRIVRGLGPRSGLQARYAHDDILRALGDGAERLTGRVVVVMLRA